MPIISPDAKGIASRIARESQSRSKDFFPEEAYRPHIYSNGDWSIDPRGKKIASCSDGLGTKGELAERLANKYKNPKFYRTLGSNVAAMVADDTARKGRFTVGIVNDLNVDSAADEPFIREVVGGLEDACAAGKFALLDGETAEMGSRVPGFGKNHVMWDASALQIVNEEKMILGEHLKPGQPVVGLRERGIRSNGLSLARRILEQAYLIKHAGAATKREWIIQDIRRNIGNTVDDATIERVLQGLPSGFEKFCEQEHVPWHEMYPKLTEELLRPATIYSPLIYAAQGGVDGVVQVPIVDCAHITGGGVPEKAYRMVKNKGIGVAFDTVFPDPLAVKELIEIGKGLPTPLLDEIKASDNWNRGLGFICVFANDADAKAFIQLAEEMGYEAAITGKTIAEKEIRWRGEAWTY